ncbi:calcium-binding protein [Streptomyces sp. JNUCC 64]
MRRRASVALLSGALVLSALSVPAAQAAQSDVGAAGGSPRINKVTVNGGKDVVVGLAKKRFVVELNAYRGHVAKITGQTQVYRGAIRTPDAYLGYTHYTEDPCHWLPGLTCKDLVDVDPKTDGVNRNLTNKDAGVWKVYAALVEDQQDGAYDEKLEAATFKLKRAAKLTVDVAPGSVRRGADLTVKGDLTRANWDTNAYGGFLSNSVKLQFKKRGGSWATVKTVSADSRGKVSTTVKASVDGEYRFTYGGSTTTGGAASAADFVDVR